MSNLVKCEFWQPEKNQIEQRQQSIKKHLCLTIKKLKEIVQILKEDSEQNK